MSEYMRLPESLGIDNEVKNIYWKAEVWSMVKTYKCVYGRKDVKRGKPV